MGKEERHQATRGQPGYVSVDDTQAIVAKTKRSLVDGVTVEAFTRAINLAIEQAAIRGQSEPVRSHAKDVRKLISAFETYVRLAKELRRHDIFPPMPPTAWHASVSIWKRNIEHAGQVADPVSRGPKPAKTKEFYPYALGLYHAAFGEVPGVSADSDLGFSGPMVRFLEACITAAVQSPIKLQVHSVPPKLYEPRGEWEMPKLNTVRQDLRAARDLVRDHVLAHQSEEPAPLTPVWKDYSRFFSEICLSISSQTD